jgi:hypothetical protein
MYRIKYNLFDLEDNVLAFGEVDARKILGKIEPFGVKGVGLNFYYESDAKSFAKHFEAVYYKAKSVKVTTEVYEI